MLYSAKTQRGKLVTNEPCPFLHTGLYGVFVYADKAFISRCREIKAFYMFGR